MFEQKILIAYASRYGSTAQIAENIALRLRKDGLNAIAKDVRNIISLKDYSAVVLGSAVYAGKWLEEAVKFMHNFQQEMMKRPTWFFSAGRIRKIDPVEKMEGWRFPEDLQQLAVAIHPRDIAFFHGVLDISKLRLAEQLIILALNAPVGDFRDWDQINEWADKIARALKPERMLIGE